MSDQSSTSESETTTESIPEDEGQTDALDRAAEAIQEAKEAGAGVAAHEDITAVGEGRPDDVSPAPADADD